MPRAALKIQGAPNKTRWTLARSNESTPVRQTFDVAVKEDLPGAKEREAAFPVEMQVPQQHQQPNGLYFHDEQQQHLPRYSYDGSQYSSQSGHMSAQGAPWRGQQGSDVNGNYGNNYDGFDFNMDGSPVDARASNRISVNTGVRNVQRHADQDAVSQHLLYETALMDSQAFEMLDIAEVDALKKEHVRLNQKIEATQRKLALESKVRDAAQNLQRLYSTKNRPDTPLDSPDSAKKSRSSLLGRGRTTSSGSMEHLQQADNELAASVKKVDQLHHAVKDLLDRRQFVERKLLRHTAAVLAEEANRKVESAVPGLVNGSHALFDEDERSLYTPNEFDGIRDILHGMPAGASSKVKEHEEQLASMQARLEQLNVQLRDVINEASQTLGKPPTAEAALDKSEDSGSRVENRFVRLEDSLYTLEQQQRDVKSHYSRIQDDQYMTKNAVEQQLQGLNSQLHKVLTLASESQTIPDLQDPPQPSGHGYQDQMQYLEDSLLMLERVQQQQQQQSGAAQQLSEQKLSEQKASEQKLSEYETTISGLWDILQPIPPSRRPSAYDDDDDDDDDDGPPTPLTPLKDSFSLPAFNALVQNIYDRAQSAKEQQDILRRQIQQQRDLNGKSDAEKDREIAEWQDKHNGLVEDHSGLQQELANWMVKHEHTEGEANQSRTELMNVMTELEEMKKTMDAKQAERDEVSNRMREQLEQMQSRMQDHANAQEEIENLELDVARLKSELTMSEANLEAAYGNKQERKGAQAAEVQALTDKNRAMAEQVSQLERELGEMTSEFQELTKESIELEKEREQLDALIDSLRDRCDVLETQLSDEKLRWVGIKSPTSGGVQDGMAAAREGTSMMVLRQEFKKMMRDQRSEGIKLLRVCHASSYLCKP
jgi:chromosome segregation ATPase